MLDPQAAAHAARLPVSSSSGQDPWVQPIRALVLDIDDTLVDTQAAMREAGARAASAALPWLDSAAHQAISDTYYDDHGGHFDAYTRGELTFPDQRRLRFEGSLRHLGLPAAHAQSFGAYEVAYLEAFAQVQTLFDDVSVLFTAARERAVALCLLTNSGAEQTALKLKAVGLEGIAPVVTTDTLGVGKPDPRLFARACALAGVEPQAAVCVGDTLDTDVRGALGAGMRVAWLCRPDRPEPRNAGWGTPVDDSRIRIVPDLREVAYLLAGVG
ncbi:MAG: HAD family hydrolase [Micrococcales bacterium]|nr:HAD family hydrolase [Micrococcales bacterium]